MKVTDSIKSAEQALLDSIAKNLDLDNIKKLFQEKYHIELKEDINYADSDIIIYRNELAYKFDFNVKMRVSVFCDRNGDCFKLLINNDGEIETKDRDEAAEKPSSKAYLYEPREDILNTAAHIADMMSEINKEK